MNINNANQPFVVWATCFLWFTSMFAIAWSLILFFSVGDILILAGMDLVNAFVLLSGVIMLPTNLTMFYSIANGKNIDYKAKVVCCPLWFSILWIIIINAVAAIMCFLKILSCHELITKHVYLGMKSYRSVPKYKHFLDTIQWSLKCCGLDSYKDWFSQDWYDRIRDYEWDISALQNSDTVKTNSAHSDSVPLSCCKSGSCISNYLTELGTYSINTNGCAPLMSRIIMVSLNVHFAMFLLIVILEIIILKLIMKEEHSIKVISRRNDIKHIMPATENFEICSVFENSNDNSEISE